MYMAPLWRSDRRRASAPQTVRTCRRNEAERQRMLLAPAAERARRLSSPEVKPSNAVIDKPPSIRILWPKVRFRSAASMVQVKVKELAFSTEICTIAPACACVRAKTPSTLPEVPFAEHLTAPLSGVSPTMAVAPPGK